MTPQALSALVCEVGLERAAERVEEAFDDSTSARAWALRAWLAIWRGVPKQALPLAQAARDADPDDPGCQLVLAEALFRLGRAAEAHVLLAGQGSTAPLVASLRARCRAALQDRASAHAALRTLPAGTVEGLVARAWVQFLLGDDADGYGFLADVGAPVAAHPDVVTVRVLARHFAGGDVAQPAALRSLLAGRLRESPSAARVDGPVRAELRRVVEAGGFTGALLLMLALGGAVSVIHPLLSLSVGSAAGLALLWAARG